jgi:hypothetical protein
MQIQIQYMQTQIQEGSRRFRFLSSTLPMGAPGHPKGEGEPEVLLSRCSGKSLRDLSRIASGEKTLMSILQMMKVKNLKNENFYLRR